MAEWLNAAVLKTVEAATFPGVRIPLSLQKTFSFNKGLFCLMLVVLVTQVDCSKIEKKKLPLISRIDTNLKIYF